MGISTKTGDRGETTLPGSSGVSKTDPRIEALGTADELDAFLADALLAGPSSETGKILAALREELSGVLMPAIARLPAVGETTREKEHPGEAPAPDITRLEGWIAELEGRRPPSGFIHAWKTQAAAKLNIARTVCRRAERRIALVSGALSGPADSGAVLAWFNRLSDLLFLLAAAELNKSSKP
ncbi:MAG: ATP:cob(I)alamin adenosyltransferase [Treponema sp.]|jgi:cob(I)alamin adenosyltransferase|nr:ATP:cob(I)alamin adenosyltransferase [Treponema sp.]